MEEARKRKKEAESEGEEPGSGALGSPLLTKERVRVR